MDSKKSPNRRSKRKPKGTEENYWDCSVCTYQNSPEAFKCLMCDVRKGTSTRKPSFNSQQVAQQFTQAQPKQKDTTKVDRKVTEATASPESQPKKRARPRLKNIDRSSAQQKAVTVNNVTVIITEFQPKQPVSTDIATNGPQERNSIGSGNVSNDASHSGTKRSGIYTEKR
ncbi:YY1-associated factor 2-like [Limulus polyphemus]|uniref:YY1-associated factor 2-like n=1 Tax=Limulus polyphemus TaxID=6850 RepID=A0ABM1AZN5_LIMPO|nr:YY1-associated factor 2-like [Limulus polyphemus]XP_022238472.1 YY1-associated factor 2-like [Limulus polyphemus]